MKRTFIKNIKYFFNLTKKSVSPAPNNAYQSIIHLLNKNMALMTTVRFLRIIGAKTAWSITSPQVSFPLTLSVSFKPQRLLFHSLCDASAAQPIEKSLLTLSMSVFSTKKSFQVAWERSGVRGHLFTFASSLSFHTMSSMQARASSLESCPPTANKNHTYTLSVIWSLLFLHVIIKCYIASFKAWINKQKKISIFKIYSHWTN